MNLKKAIENRDRLWELYLIAKRERIQKCIDENNIYQVEFATKGIPLDYSRGKGR